MKKIILLLLAVVILGGGAYTLLRTSPEVTNDSQQVQYATYSNTDLGLQFEYRAGERGYIIQELSPSDTKSGLLRTIVVTREEDVANAPINGEGAPTITIHVLKNLQKQQPQNWAETHYQYSNINLKMNDATETSVGGAKAIRYKADGLYVSDNHVIAHGDNVYVVSGMYMDENSDIRRDYMPLLDSIRFIPAPGQE